MNPIERSIAVGILHDGTISSIEKNTNKLIMKVNISYLAEIIDPKYEFFIYHFINCDSCYFVHRETEIRTDNITEIRGMNLEINESEPEGEYVKIFCIRDKVINGGYI